jgi:FtsX-like permease family protein
MIRLAIRLTLSGGREAVVRLVITAAAVALGVGLLLAALAASNALTAQSLRRGWLNNTGAPPGSAPATPGASPEWWYPSFDGYGDQEINRVDVAALGPHPPVPPGIPHLPGPGQYYASPALSALLRSVPAGQLADRYPGRQIGTIGPAALPAPGSLIVVIGHAPAQLAHVPGAMRVTRIGTGRGDSPQAIAAVLGIVALALLFPVLVFISTATRLAAARREQRFAAMRLAGATPRQVSAVAAVEAAAAAITGTAAGFVLFFAFRPDLAKIPFTGQAFFPGDARLSLPTIVIVAVGIPVAAAVVAHVALRRVRISPLGTARRVRARRPGTWRILPLLAGLCDLAYFTAVGHPATLNGQLLAYLGGGALTVAGLVIAGPWLTMAGSALLARWTSRPAGLLAARRLADNPRAAFRAISGLILAVFTATVAVGIITSMTESHAMQTGGTTGKSILITNLGGLDRPGPQIPDTAPSGVAISPSLTGRLRDVPGVSAVMVSHLDPLGTSDDGLVDCRQLARLPALGSCAPGASVAAVRLQPHGATAWAHHTVWPAAHVPPTRLDSLPASGIVVGTDGSTAAIERARTMIVAAFPFQASPATVFETQGARLLSAWQQLADVVILVGLPIAGCSLAVSVVAGLTDRRRPFSLLRLAGTPAGLLCRVVALESAVPLLVVTIVSAGLGLLVAELFLNSQLGLNLRPPGPAYYGFIAGGVLLSLGIIAATFPLLARITGPEAARSE